MLLGTASHEEGRRILSPLDDLAVDGSADDIASGAVGILVEVTVEAGVTGRVGRDSAQRAQDEKRLDLHLD